MRDQLERQRLRYLLESEELLPRSQCHRGIIAKAALAFCVLNTAALIFLYLKH